jgi:hypothetical protein
MGAASAAKSSERRLAVKVSDMGNPEVTAGTATGAHPRQRASEAERMERRLLIRKTTKSGSCAYFLV